MKQNVIIKEENIEMSFNFTFAGNAEQAKRSEQVGCSSAEKVKKLKVSLYSILLLEIIPALE